MTLEAFHTLIASLDLPVVYGYYRSEQNPPYIAYASTMRNVFHADGIVIYAEEWIELHLITVRRDLSAERAVELLLNANQIAFDSPDLAFDEKQGIHEAIYYFQL
jgi:hypothetical protein